MKCQTKFFSSFLKKNFITKLDTKTRRRKIAIQSTIFSSFNNVSYLVPSTFVGWQLPLDTKTKG